jgi:hypothetical protein
MPDDKSWQKLWRDMLWNIPRGRPTAADYTVVDIETGDTVCRIPTKSSLRRASFSPDGRFVFMTCADSRVMKKYDVATGALVAEVNTRVLPVNISPSQNRYVGFAADAPRVGSLVLADLASGKTLDVIRDDAFILDDACFSPNEEKIVFVESATSCGIMSVPDIARAISRLEQTALDPQLAAMSTDLVDYRERLARNYEASLGRSKHMSGMDEAQLGKAIDVWMKLYDDFPRSGEYGEAIAANEDALAAVVEEVQNQSHDEMKNRSRSQSDWSEPRQHLERALELRKKLAADFPDVAKHELAAKESEKRLDDFNARHNLSDADANATRR